MSDSSIVRSANSVEEVKDLWWPLMQELNWDRYHQDVYTHYHVARQGKDWLLLTPQGSAGPEGCVVAFTYPNHTGWVGFFIVNEAFRGKGLGRILWSSLQASFRSSETTIIGLDGVEQQVKTYERRGFQVVARIPLMVRQSLKNRPFQEGGVPYSDENTTIVDIRDVDYQGIAALDLAHTGLDRSALWAPEGVLAREDAYGYAIVSNASSQILHGIVLVRPSELGHRFGPLYAETFEQAEALLSRAMSNIESSDGTMIAETFASNPHGREVFAKLGWEYGGLDYHRMWLGGRVPKEQQQGGRGTHGMFAIFDASEG